MKHYNISTFIIGALCAASLASCSSDPDVVNLPPTIETGNFVTTSRTSASVTGKVTPNGTSITSYGIVYADDPSMIVASKYVTFDESLDGNSKQFTLPLTGLNAGHTYYYRTFIHSGYEYYYGDYKMFTTPSISAPTFDTFSINEAAVEATQVSLSAHIADLGVEANSGVTLSNPSFKYKVVSSGTSSENITFSDTDASWHTVSADYNSSSRQLTAMLMGLTSSTTYAICAYATTAGYATSNIVVITTKSTSNPEVSSVSIEKVGTTGLSIRLHANVTNEGTSAVTERGFVYSTSSDMPVYEGSVAVKADDNFTYTLTQLQNSTTYYIRAYARNDNGIGYGPVYEYTTPDVVILPSVFTVMATDVKSNSAKLVGVVNSNGLSIREMGFVFNGEKIPVQVTEGTFSFVVSGILPLTAYSFSTYCITSDGSEYTGSTVSFTTKAAPADDDVVYPDIK